MINKSTAAINRSVYEVYSKEQMSGRSSKSPLEVGSLRKEESQPLFDALQNLKENTKKRKGVQEQREEAAAPSIRTTNQHKR